MTGITPASLPPAGASPASAEKAAAKSAHDFEAVFVGQMTKMMMESVETQGQFGGGHGEEMFRGVLAEQLGGAITARGGLGLAPAVMKQIIAMQGGLPAAPPATTIFMPVSKGQIDAR